MELIERLGLLLEQIELVYEVPLRRAKSDAYWPVMIVSGLIIPTDIVLDNDLLINVLFYGTALFVILLVFLYAVEATFSYRYGRALDEISPYLDMNEFN